MKQINKIVENVSLELLITLNVIILIATALMSMYILWRYTTEQRLERKKRDLKNWNEGYRCGLQDGSLGHYKEPNPPGTWSG